LSRSVLRFGHSHWAPRSASSCSLAGSRALLVQRCETRVVTL
jgi:hypothetical protein